MFVNIIISCEYNYWVALGAVVQVALHHHYICLQSDVIDTHVREPLRSSIKSALSWRGEGTAASDPPTLDRRPRLMLKPTH